MSRRVRSILFNALWALWTVLLGSAGVLALPSGHACRVAARIWSRGTLLLVRRVLGISLRIEGAPQAGPAIYASKHQSTLETMALWVALGDPAFVLKRELLWIPIFGWFLARTRPIAINRAKGGKAAQQIARQGAPRLAEGRNIVIFPEGTRRAFGAPPRYKSGGLWALYQLGAPIVPVALNTGRYWPKAGYTGPGEAVIRFLDPLPPGISRDLLAQQLEQAIETAGEKL